MNAQLQAQLAKTRNLHVGMEEDLSAAAETRWLKKPVLKQRAVPMVEAFDQLSMVGPGLLGIDEQRSISGKGSLRLTYSSVQPIQNPRGRAYTTTEVFVPFAHENLTEFNRISVWMYVASQNNSVNHTTVALHNAGPRLEPVPGRFEGFHAQTMPSNEWVHMVWEIANLCREQVTAIAFTVHASGTTLPGDPIITYLFDELCLETVEVDKDRGFELRKNAIAYCHSGYRADARKQALVQQRQGAFLLKDEAGNVVYRGTSIAQRDGFELLDFSAFTAEGLVTLCMGELETKPFFIGREAYLGAAWKTLNYFFVDRCGFNVPKVHTECHLDVMSVHPDGRKKCVAGGWHDAGDLTQDGRNTAECTLAMLELALAAQEKEQALSDRSLEEARWGLDWLMRTRWGDGMRHCGKIISTWTDNIIGGTDDIDTPAENRPYDNLLVASVFAKAAVVFGVEDPMYAHLCARYAKEDYLFGIEWMHKAPAKSFSIATQLQLNAQAALTGIELYKAFGLEEHLSLAVRFARVVMNCQCKEPDPNFELPLYGYFYETDRCERVQAYFHRSYEQVPIQALCALLLNAPTHHDAPKWKQSLNAYAAYLKMLEAVTPYGLLASGVYELDNADFTNIYHEGDQSKGGPSLEEFNAQIKNGIKLDERHYLRIFPVAFQFRGFHAPLMGKALAALELHKALGDDSLRQIAYRQLEWMLGYNPFAASSVFGEGYDYHPLYTALQPQIVGAVPVGFETYENEDVPYYPIQNLATYKEIWVHTTCRLMKCIAYIGF